MAREYIFTTNQLDHIFLWLRLCTWQKETHPAGIDSTEQNSKKEACQRPTVMMQQNGTLNIVSVPFFFLFFLNVFSALRLCTWKNCIPGGGKIFIFKLENNLFKLISLHNKHRMQHQYFICVELFKQTGGLELVSKVIISSSVILKR